jgi:UDP-galactose transporter B1
VKNTCKEINNNKDAKLTPYEMMFYSNFSGAIAALVASGATGQLQEGIAFCQRSPEILVAILSFAACSAVGQCFIFFLLNEFSALVTTTVTTTRKIFSTVIISCNSHALVINIMFLLLPAGVLGVPQS